MVKRLVPCECGGQPAIKSVSYIRGRWFWAQCSSCLARSTDRASLEEAVADWNQKIRREHGKARQPHQPAAEPKQLRRAAAGGKRRK